MQQQTVYVPVASPPTPVPSPGPGPQQFHLQQQYRDRDHRSHSHSSASASSGTSSPSPSPSPTTDSSRTDNPAPDLDLITTGVDTDAIAIAAATAARDPDGIRRTYLTAILSSCTPSELLFISTTIAPLLKRDFLRDLPAELGLQIVRWVSVEEPRSLGRMAGVSRAWRDLLEDESIWRGMCGVWNVPPKPKVNLRRGGLGGYGYAGIAFKEHFISTYITRTNWRSGGRLLRSHKLPSLSASSAAHSASNNESAAAAGGGGAGGGSADVITSLSLFSTFVIVGLANSKILVFSAESGVLQRTLVGHEAGVWSVWGVAKGGWNVLDQESRSSHRANAGKGKSKSKKGNSDLPPHIQSLPKSLRYAVGLGDVEADDDTAQQSQPHPHPHPHPQAHSHSTSTSSRRRRIPKTTPGTTGTERKSNTCASPGFGQPNALLISGGCDKVVKVWDLKSG
jgi:F-box and WD-40 domain protein CDC4